MHHFSLEEWADFARNVVGQEQKAAMERHLQTGCKQCARVVELWQHVRDAARREPSYAPPGSAVRTIKGLFAIHGTAGSRRAKRGTAELIFDSFRDPLTADVRSASATAEPRQLLYDAGDYRIDVRIEPLEDDDQVSLIGQILTAAASDASLGAIPVMLFGGRRLVAASFTNELGEFQFNCQLVGGYQLQVLLPGQPTVCISLVDPFTWRSRNASDVVDSRGARNTALPAKRSTRKRV